MKTRFESSHARTNSAILGEESVAGVHGVTARRLGRRDDVRDAEVALCGGRRADAHGVVGELDVERVTIGRRVHGDRLDSELAEGADHAHGDLAPVRDEHAVEHDST